MLPLLPGLWLGNKYRILIFLLVFVEELLVFGEDECTRYKIERVAIEITRD